jgi:hypothetical protein
MPELTITSPYVHSIVDSNTFSMGNPMPESTLSQSGTLDLASEHAAKVHYLFAGVMEGNWTTFSLLTTNFSVPDPGCLSRIPDPTFFHPGSELSPSRIPDPHQRI